MSKIKKLFSRATGVADLEKVDELAQNSPNRNKIFATADKAVLKAMIYGWTMGMLTAATGAFIIATSPRTRKTQKMTNV